MSTQDIESINKQILHLQKKICKLKKTRNRVANEKRPQYTMEIEKLKSQIQVLAADRKILRTVVERNAIMGNAGLADDIPYGVSVQVIVVEKNK